MGMELKFLGKFDGTNGVYPEVNQYSLTVGATDGSIYISNKYGNPFSKTGNALCIDQGAVKFTNGYQLSGCYFGNGNLIIDGWFYCSSESKKNYTNAGAYLLFGRVNSYKYFGLYATTASGNNAAVNGNGYKLVVRNNASSNASSNAQTTAVSYLDDSNTLNQWHHFVIQFTRGFTSRHDLFIDGEHIAGNSNAISVNTVATFNLGKNPGTTNTGGGVVCAFSNLRIRMGTDPDRSNSPTICGQYVVPTRPYTTTEGLDTTLRLIATKNGLYDPDDPARIVNGGSTTAGNWRYAYAPSTDPRYSMIAKGGKFNNYCLKLFTKAASNNSNTNYIKFLNLGGEHDSAVNISNEHDWTISFWCYILAKDEWYGRMILIKQGTNTSDSYVEEFNRSESTGDYWDARSADIDFWNADSKKMGVRTLSLANTSKTGTPSESHTGRITIPERKWHHIAIVNGAGTTSSTALTRTWYLDGKKISSSTATTSIAYLNLLLGFFLGFNTGNNNIPSQSTKPDNSQININTGAVFIDDFYINAGERVWTAEFDPPTSPFTRDPNWATEDLSEEPKDTLDLEFTNTSLITTDSTSGNRTNSLSPGANFYLEKSGLLYTEVEFLIKWEWYIAFEIKYISGEAGDWNKMFGFGPHYSVHKSDASYFGITTEQAWNTQTYIDNEWHKVLLVHDPKTRKLYGFIDGKQCISQYLTDGNFNNELAIASGCYFGGSGNEFTITCDIKNVIMRIYDQNYLLRYDYNYFNKGLLSYDTSSTALFAATGDVDVTWFLKAVTSAATYGNYQYGGATNQLNSTTVKTHYTRGLKMESNKWFQITKIFYFNQPTTIESYIYIDKESLGSGINPIFAFTGDMTDSLYSIKLVADLTTNQLRLAFINDDYLDLGSLNELRISSQPFHFALVLIPNTLEFRVYINGKLKTSGGITDSSFIWKGPYSLIFGACYDANKTLISNSGATGTMNAFKVTPTEKYTGETFTIDINDIDGESGKTTVTFDFHGVYIF